MLQTFSTITSWVMEITDEPVEEQKISAEGVTPDVAAPAAAIPSIANVWPIRKLQRLRKGNIEETTPEEEVTAFLQLRIHRKKLSIQLQQSLRQLPEELGRSNL